MLGWLTRLLAKEKSTKDVSPVKCSSLNIYKTRCEEKSGGK